MSESETPLHDDHWRRLAAELGLDIGPAPEHSEVHERTEVEREGSQHVRQEERRSTSDRGRRKRNPPPQEDRIGQGFAEGLTPDDSVVEFEVVATTSTDDLFADSDEPESRSVLENEQLPATDEAQSAIPETESEKAAEAPDKQRRRRRSRRKKKGTGDSPSSEAGEPISDASGDDEPIARTESDQEDQSDDLSKNWNVPSWDELIGSLYRPER